MSVTVEFFDENFENVDRYIVGIVLQQAGVPDTPEFFQVITRGAIVSESIFDIPNAIPRTLYKATVVDITPDSSQTVFARIGSVPAGELLVRNFTAASIESDKHFFTPPEIITVCIP